ncbi:PREDICTED: prosaposin-like [Ipomoea nil]|uniref:prosaposin-like n=1 Tax=Ipomoea nil TaxID=35883 RepID=UPI000901489B|nr:PREDICTED: prosaposin-like [Ipomoea nil]
MDRRLCFVVVVVLAAISSWCCSAKDLAAADLKTQSLEEQVQVSGNEDQCSLCKQIASNVITYFSENYQTLYSLCYALFDLFPQCFEIVEEISSSDPETLCKSVHLCEGVVSISQYASNSSCDLCHRAVMGAIQKLKNPDTQVEVLQLFLRACDSAKKISTKCKKLVFEYAPSILMNAEQFPITNDICTLLHVCDSPTLGIEHSAS